MKKRMRLTEKQLAIGMWLYVKMCILYSDDLMIVAQAKSVYLMNHPIAIMLFTNNCILCEKYNLDCSKCPLGSCSKTYKTLWSVVNNRVYNVDYGRYWSPFTLQERLEACDKIIEAIEKDIPDDYGDNSHNDDENFWYT